MDDPDSWDENIHVPYEFSFDGMKPDPRAKLRSSDVEPLIKALEQSDVRISNHFPINLSENDQLYTELVKFVYNKSKNIIETPDSLENVGINLNEDLVKDITYKLTSVILNTSDPVDELNKLSLRDQPSNVCGRIFARGEYLYTCKDCGVDPTCVMCPACFNASEHVNHRYRVSRSGGGGGTCDCGDLEAWKEHPACRNHSKKAQTEVSDGDKDLRKRIKTLFAQVLRLAVEILYSDICRTDDVSGALKSIIEQWEVVKTEEEECALILYNDEVHSYDEVERMLKMAVQANSEQAHTYATHIDKRGRTSLLTGSREKCEEVLKVIRTGKDKLTKIKLLIIDSNILALQEVAFKLLSWMNWLSGKGEIFRIAFCDAYLSSGYSKKIKVRNAEFWEHEKDQPFITHIMISDIGTWKAVRSIMMKNLLETMLKDPENKMKVAQFFTEHYQTIYDNFFHRDDHDQQFSSSSISVQIFTTPTVVKELMQFHKLFEKIGKMTYDWYFPTNKTSGMRELKNLTERRPGNRSNCYPIDITYILHNPPVTEDEQFRKTIKEGIFWLLEMFRLFEAREGVKWSHKHHVEEEPDWENLMTFIFSAQGTYTKLLQWARRDEYVTNYCIETILARYLETSNDEFPPKSFNRKVLNQMFNFIPIDVQTKKVHIYNMYSRIFTYCMSSPEISSKYNEKQIAYSCHKSIESLCVSAQSKAGFWKKNGQSHQFTMFYYSDQRCKRLLFNMDLQAAQLMVSQQDPNEFLAMFIDAVGLNNAWLFNNDPEITSASISEDTKFIKKDQLLKQMAKESTYMPSLLDEFLLILIRIISEPFMENSMISRGQQVRRSLIHILALDYLPWSKIKKKLDHQWDADVASEAEELLEELSQYKNVKGVRHYSLKAVYAKEWDRFYIGYENAEQSKSLEHVNHLLKSEPKGLKDTIFIPKKRYEHRTPYDKALGLLDCDLFKKLTGLVLKLDDPLASAVEKLGYLLALALLHGRGGWIKEQGVDKELAKWGDENSGGKTTFPWLEWIQNQVGNASDGAAKAEDSKSEWKKRAAASRAALLAKMKKQQSNAMKNFSHDMTKSFEEETSEETMGEEDNEFQVAPEITELFLDRDDKFSMSKINTIDDVWTCILCQSDSQVESESDDPLLMLGYFEESTVLDRYKTREEILHDHELFLDHDWARPLDAKCGTHLTTCGHVLHHSCFEKSLEIAKNQENRYSQIRFREGSWKLPKEFTCMLCSRICNTVMPLIDRATHKRLRFEPKRDITSIAEKPKTVGQKIDAMKKEETSTKMSKDIKFFEWLSELQDEFGFPKKHQPQNYVVSLGTIDMGEAGDKNYKEKQSAADLNDNDEEESTVDDLNRGFVEEKSTVGEKSTTNHSFDSENCDEESIGSTDSDAPRMSKFSRIVHTYRDIHQNYEKNGNGHFQTASYSIAAAEALLRYDNKPLMGSLPVRKDKGLEFLIRSALYLFGSAETGKAEDEYLSSTRQEARVIIKNIIADPRMTYDVPALLTLDLFHVYLTLLLDLPYLDHLKPLQHQKIADKFFFRLILAAQITQIALFTSNSIIFEEPEVFTEVDDCQASVFAYLVYQLRSHYRGLEPLHVSPFMIYQHFIQCLTPFVRKVSLLLMYLNLLEPPPELSDGRTSWESMCLCLGIPDSLCELFDADGGALEPYAERWIKQLISREDKFSLKNALKDVSFPQLIEIPSLATLPSDYRNVLTMVAEAKSEPIPVVNQENEENSANNAELKKAKSNQQICPAIKNPAVCLLCNKVVCVLSDSYSEKIDDTLYGGGLHHAMTCGRGIGLFMLVAFSDRNAYTDAIFQFCSGVKIILRDPEVVGIQSDILLRGDLFRPRNIKPVQVGLVNFDLPYVDSHGEPDRGLKSGAKLLLSSENYERLRREWLAHEISDSVSREIELGSSRTHLMSSHWYSF